MKNEEQNINPFIKQVNKLLGEFSAKQQSRGSVSPRITCTRLRRLREIRRELVVDAETSSESELVQDSISSEKDGAKQRNESFAEWVARNQQAHKQYAEAQNQIQAHAEQIPVKEIKDNDRTVYGFANFAPSSLKSVARNPNTPMSTLKWLAAHYRSEVREALAANENAGVEIRTVLSRDSEDKVRLAVLDNQNLEHKLLLKLCDDHSPLVSEKAKNMLYEKTKFQLKDDEVDNVQADLNEVEQTKPEAILSRPKINDQESQVIEREFLKVIAERSTTPPRRLAELANHADPAIRSLVANNPNCTPEIFWKLANDPIPEVRIKLFGNYNCPADIIQHLKEAV